MPRITVWAFLLLLPFLSATAEAQSGVKQGEVRLISGVNGVGNLSEIPVGLDVTLNSGWHTYWRSPGDAGMPPQLSWQGSDYHSVNVAGVALHYPVPERHIIAGLETIGYDGHLIFPLNVTPQNPGQPVELVGKLTLLVCSDICVPNDFDLQLKIPAGAATPSAAADQLNAWRARVPTRDTAAWHITGTRSGDDGSTLVDFLAANPLQEPKAFAETADGGIFSPPEVTLKDDKKSGTIKLVLRHGSEMPQPPLVTLTLADGKHGWEDSVQIAAAAPQSALRAPAVQTPLPASLLTMLLFAFLGGMILNLMPCVLPVLSLKILKFMGHGGREDHEARHSFLATSAGIITSFLLLAGIMLGLRAAGHSIGWGLQFQHPGFLFFLIVVLLVFAGNMWGLFEIRLPAALNDRIFSASTHHPKLLGDFLTGGFATLLATPCTAPFLGTAIGFALGSGATEILAIFAGMGFGMATPYLLVAAFPGLATRMPRPGAWMVRLRRMLALALLATAVWLGCILVMQAQQADAPMKFDEAAIPRHVADGKTVFVDVTAAWCITCQVNKKLVLERADIAARLKSPDVVFLQRDWTKPDADIADYLHRFGKGGIPFNVIYGPGAPEGIVLPELLTPDIVTEVLDKAALKP
ncbi:MAG: protein-disulfide reductase DsbD domain-containing protein [Alphaproteobacteria bacterium]